ncbi:MAG: transglutaminase-like domain-containing protein [Defluviitaleaceae bacterium]|nr:transglutaminase-like domain-containing protein [Defluviitaleaceae bacterium]
MSNFTNTKSGLFSRFTRIDTVFLLVVGTLLVWSLSMAVIAGTYLAFDPLGTLMRVFFVMIILRLIFLNKSSLIFAGAVIAVAGLILLVDMVLASSAAPVIDDAHAYLYHEAFTPRYSMISEFSSFIQGTIGFVTGFELYTAAYDSAIQWALIIGLSIFVFVFGFFWFNFFAILTTTLLFGLMLNTGFFFYTISFYVFIFCLISYLIRHLNLRSMGKEHKYSPFSLYALPLTAVCLAIAIALPAPASGAGAQFVENFIRQPFANANNFFQSAFHPRHFSLAHTGFGMGNTRHLGGNVTANYDTFMRVNHQGPLYLTGNVFDTYTGFSWINSDREFSYELDFTQMIPNIEAFERLTSPLTMNIDSEYFSFFDRYNYAMEHRDRDTTVRMIHQEGAVAHIWHVHLPQLNLPETIVAEATEIQLEERRLLVEHDMRKLTVFTTGLVSNVVPPNEYTTFIRDFNGSVQSDILLERGARYEIFYANLPEEINHAALLAASRPGLFMDVYNRLWEERLENGFDDPLLFTHNGIQIPYQELVWNYLIGRAANIQEVYTTLPSHFPERIRELARNVVDTSDAATSLEKAVVLEDFLRSSFGYNLSPGNTPMDRDFVDHFLFDLQMGYCTHFASTFVIMARSLGLPTRYVEGFIVSGDADADGYLTVINRQGHAWAEVYFEGFGWHRFDPTPPEAIFTWPEATSADPFYDDWYDVAQLMDWSDSGNWEGLWGGDDLDDYFIYGHMPAAVQMQTGDAANAGINLSITQIFIWSLIITSSLAIALMVSRVIYYETKKLSATNKPSNNEAAVAYYRQILRYMCLFDYEIEPHETAVTFGRRVRNKITFDNEKILMADLSQIFSRAHYGHDEISDDERKLMVVAIKSLDRRLWSYMGARRYILYKYIMCIV